MQDIFPSDVRILTGPPTVALIARSAIDWAGVRELARWVKAHRPECLPEGYDPDNPVALFRESLDPRKRSGAPAQASMWQGHISNISFALGMIDESNPEKLYERILELRKEAGDL